MGVTERGWTVNVPQERIDRGLYWGRAWSLVSGCSPVSPGCLHCWSAREAHMRGGQSNAKMQARYGGLTDAQGRWTGEIRLMTQDLDKPLRVKEPTSWAIWNDLFHEDVPDHFIYNAFFNMVEAHWHTFLVLTKRPERMRAFVVGELEKAWSLEDRKHIHFGVTAENSDYFWRIDELMRTPAAVRFVSLEPLLSLVDLKFGPKRDCHWCLGKGQWDPVGGGDPVVCECMTKNKLLSWVACGGESGPNARYCNPDWIRDIITQCKVAGIKAFVKQLGTAWAKQHGADYKGADMRFWPADLRVREFPEW